MEKRKFENERELGRAGYINLAKRATKRIRGETWRGLEGNKRIREPLKTTLGQSGGKGGEEHEEIPVCLRSKMTMV